MISEAPVGIVATIVDREGREHIAEINRPYRHGNCSFVIQDLGIAPLIMPVTLELIHCWAMGKSSSGTAIQTTANTAMRGHDELGIGRRVAGIAAITRRAEGYYIVHVESGKEGDFPLVNGQPIGPQARKLADNDVVQLAGVKMGFFAA